MSFYKRKSVVTNSQNVLKICNHRTYTFKQLCGNLVFMTIFFFPILKKWFSKVMAVAQWNFFLVGVNWHSSLQKSKDFTHLKAANLCPQLPCTPGAERYCIVSVKKTKPPRMIQCPAPLAGLWIPRQQCHTHSPVPLSPASIRGALSPAVPQLGTSSGLCGEATGLASWSLSREGCMWHWSYNVGSFLKHRELLAEKKKNGHQLWCRNSTSRNLLLE